MPLRISSVFRSTITIDGETIPIKIKRLDPSEALAFNRQFTRMGQAAIKQRAGDVTLSPEDEDQSEQKAKDFLVQAVSQFVTVEPGYIYLDDSDVPLTKGEDLVRTFGARDDVLSELLLLIFMENRLNAEQKETWKTRLAPFVPTPAVVADRMMAIAEVGPADVVIDLGCGDGSLCLAAARCGATVRGYDIDADRIAEATAAAVAAGVAERCTFVHQDALQADLSGATVVALYLLSGAHGKLRPILHKQLPVGARVVTHAFQMGGDWVPSQTEYVEFTEDEKAANAQLAHSGARWIYLYRRK